MNEEASIAFAPLEQRAAQGRNPPDRISVRDHVVAVEIGAFQAERDVTQRLRFSVVVEVAPSDGAKTDDVDDILSYDAVTEAIQAELAAERLNLLETLAERIAERILNEPQPLRVFVRIEKLDRGAGNLGVEIVRGRDTTNGQQASTAGPRPIVVFLGGGVSQDPEFARFLDRLEADKRAFVLCVDAPGLGADNLGKVPAQRHIDLLSIEQNAWRLSAIDPRCVVVATRTELDWGMKNDQISVWAPSKLVLDAVDGPQPTDPLGLAVWFAMRIGAQELLLVGTDRAVRESIPTREILIGDTP